jgi:hypothetical protein
MYTFDANEAKKADQKGGYIDETGKYKGKFTRVEDLHATTGTKGVGFTFMSEDGRTVSFSVYTVKADGTTLPGNQFMMALMACMGLRTTGEAVMQKVKRYDYDAKQEYAEDAPVYPTMMNKPIGLLLQRCEYEKEKDRVKTGEYAWKMEPYAPFQADSELLATEILNKVTKPEMLPKMVMALRDRPLKNKSGASRPAASSAPSSGGPMNDMDDDIPFLPTGFRKAWAI